MKKTGFFLLTFFLIFALIETRYLITDGFNTKRIVYGASYREENEFFDKDFGKFSSILKEEFSYFSKGRQTYVFESSDKKYVLKFIRYHKYRYPFWSTFISRFKPEFLDTYFSAKRKKLNFVLNSYKLSLSELKATSQVEYVHLNQTDYINKKVIIKDKLGLRHEVNLDDVAFIIQKKSLPLKKTLMGLILQGKNEEIKKIIDSFFKVLSYRTKKQIVNIDYLNIVRNCGLDGFNIIEQDTGSFCFVKDDKICLRQNYFHSVKEFRAFLEKNAQAFLPFFDERLSKEKECLNI